VVPADIVAAMDQAASAGNARERGLELTARVVREMKGICQGVHVMAIGWEAEVAQILAVAGVRG
jgi:5,10-methylenetetrahydrofolate reductase